MLQNCARAVLLILALTFSQGCILNLGQQPQQPPPVDPGQVPGGPITTPTSTIPGTTTPPTATAPGTTTPGVLGVAITAANPTAVSGTISNGALPNNAQPTSLKVDLLGQDGATVLGTATPAANATTFAITPAAALTVGQSISARATQGYPDAAGAAQTRVGTSSPVQVQAAGTPPPAGTGTTTTGTGTTTQQPIGAPTLQIQINSAGTAVQANYRGFTPGVSIAVQLQRPAGNTAGPTLTADASGGGSTNIPVNPGVQVGQTLRVVMTAANGATVGASQVSDGR